MKKTAGSSTLSRRLQMLERQIAENERCQRRLRRVLVKGKPGAAASARNVKTASLPSTPPSSPSGGRMAVRFTEDNAPIFMSGNLEALDFRSTTPGERRNRRLLLLLFLTAVMVGVLYLLLV